MLFKRNRKSKQDEELINAILGAAVMSTMADQAEPKDENQAALERAQELRKQYEAFIEVGFTEEQATAFIAALLN